jgi:hypothetical protein
VYSVLGGTIFDEDIEYNIQNQLTGFTAKLFFLTGNTIHWGIGNNTLPVMTGGTGRIVYNSFSGGTWSLKEVDENQYVLYHVVATNDIFQNIHILVGQNQYSTLKLASDGAKSEIANLKLEGLLVQEYATIGTLIYQTSSGFINSVKSKIVQSEDGSYWIDWRGYSLVTVGGSGGNLVGIDGTSGTSGKSGSSGTSSTSGTTGVQGSSGTSGVSYEIKSITVENPTSSENIIMFYSFDDITITEIQSVVKGTTPSVTINPTYNSDVSVIGTSILTTPIEINNVTTGQNITSFGSANIPANNWVLLLTTATSGTVSQLVLSIKFLK